MKLFTTFVLVLFTGIGFTQKSGDYDFHPPLKIPLVLSSNFGELRPNHFHMGLDFKTNNRIGYNLYSIEEGYVSRIKVSTYGYGKVIYIDHPNGLTSVYAHCSEFKGAIDSLVRATQEAEQNFEVEIFPGKNVIPVKRGERIALSGNTGGSTAPHLHFEIRDTKTEHALNPLLYGFPMADHRAPEMRRLKVYGITEDGYRIPGKSVEKPLVKTGTSYQISGNQLTVNADYLTSTGGLGFAFDVIDRFDGAGNPCGMYGSVLMVDGDTLFGQETKRVPFESTRYVNSHKDYEAYQSYRRKYHKCFRTKENDLPIYLNNTLGILKTKPGATHQVEYTAYDAAGNTSNITFQLNISKGEINDSDWGDLDLTSLHPQKPFQYISQNCRIEAGYATVYEPMAIDKETLCDHLGDRETPVNRAYKIKLKVEGPKDGKHYVKMTTAKGRKRTLSVDYQDDWAIATSKYFGAYSLERDEVSPTIRPVGFHSSISPNTLHLSWAIADDANGIADYDLFIDGKWHLLEYEYKTGKVTFHRPASLKGQKQVKVVVTDACGNQFVWEKSLMFQ